MSQAKQKRTKQFNLGWAFPILLLSGLAVAQEPTNEPPGLMEGAPPVEITPPAVSSPVPIATPPSRFRRPDGTTGARPPRPRPPRTAPIAPEVVPASNFQPPPNVPPGETATPEARKERPLAKGLVNLDFVDAEIDSIAKTISELTGQNFILDDRVKGKVTIMSPKPVTVQEAYQAFISALEVKGFSVVSAGKMLKIVPLRDMKSMPIPTNVEFPRGGEDIFVTRLIPLRYISTQEIIKSLRGLITKNGDMISYDPTNTLIITDSVGNLRRLIKIIEQLDQKGYQEMIELVKLRYAPARDTAEKVMTLLDLKDRGGPKPPGQPTGAAEEGGKGQLISKILPDERTNSIIIMANPEGIQRVTDLIKKIDQNLESEVSTGRIHVHHLQYANAVDLAGTLAQLTGGGGGPGRTRANRPAARRPNPQGNIRTPGSSNVVEMPPMPVMPAGGGNGGSASLFGGEVQITADEPTNALVITADPTDYESLLPVINKLDTRRPQAFIEGMIMEVDVNKTLNLGTAAHIGTQVGGADPTTIFGASGFAGTSSIAIPTDPSGLAGLTVGVQAKTIDIPVAGGEKLTIPLYGALFRALQSNGTINILSTPNILTKDNTEAEIIVGQTVSFVTLESRDANNNPVQSFNREDVALTLRVTPQINESDDITMDIFQEIQDLAPSSDNALSPTTTKRSARTTVLVKDGQTVTIGGLIGDADQETISKVPVLGDIPILGWLFKAKSRTKRRVSLMLFLTPSIVREPEDLEVLTVQKNLQRLKFLKANQVPENDGLRRYGLEKVLTVPPSKVKAPADEEIRTLPPVETPTPTPTPGPDAAAPEAPTSAEALPPAGAPSPAPTGTPSAAPQAPPAAVQPPSSATEAPSTIPAPPELTTTPVAPPQAPMDEPPAGEPDILPPLPTAVPETTR